MTSFAEKSVICAEKPFIRHKTRVFLTAFWGQMFATKVALISHSIHSTRVSPLLATRRLSTHTTNTNTSNTANNSQPSNDRDRLHNVYQQLSASLPGFFVTQHCFHIYSPHVVFEDNIRHVKTIGLNAYIKQIAFIKIWAHLKYSSKSLNVLKITEHPEDMTVRVRWRIVGTPGLGVIFMFW
ncbi:unnamed protein product, partial [Oppiella nova]